MTAKIKALALTVNEQARLIHTGAMKMGPVIPWYKHLERMKEEKALNMGKRRV